MDVTVISDLLPDVVITYRHGPIRFLMLFLISFIVFGVQYSFDIPQALEQSL